MRNRYPGHTSRSRGTRTAKGRRICNGDSGGNPARQPTVLMSNFKRGSCQATRLTISLQSSNVAIGDPTADGITGEQYARKSTSIDFTSPDFRLLSPLMNRPSRDYVIGQSVRPSPIPNASTSFCLVFRSELSAPITPVDIFSYSPRLIAQTETSSAVHASLVNIEFARCVRLPRPPSVCGCLVFINLINLTGLRAPTYFRQSGSRGRTTFPCLTSRD